MEANSNNKVLRSRKESVYYNLSGLFINFAATVCFYDFSNDDADILIWHLRPKEEKSTELFLSQIQTAPVDQAVVDLAGALYRQWHPSHGIDPNDAILAATAIRSGGRIYTQNKRHFPMPEVNVQKGWR